jgi:DHA1 family bicyclomycin/chloramphenicol resistance-like MFS transporter
MSLSVRIFICAMLLFASLAGFMATDLVLPAVPRLPEVLYGSVAETQYILAAFIFGHAIGLLLFGAVSWRFRRPHILIFAMVGFGLTSFLATQVSSIWPLVILRVFQGIFAAGSTVIAPGIMRQLFSEKGTTRALGIFSSLEALAPAMGPILGYWLLDVGDWKLSFYVLSVIGFIVAGVVLFTGNWIPRSRGEGQKGSYLSLLKSRVYLRYSLSQALCVGGLIVLVFCAPAIFVRAWGGEMKDFIIMQCVGVACFILASNSTSFFVDRFGAERVIWAGSLLSVVAALAIFIYAAAGGSEPFVITALFAPLNLSLGVRGPPGFLRAIIAGGGQDDRASSLLVLAIFISVAAGTALLAPFVDEGMVETACVVFAMELAALLFLVFLPRLAEAETGPRKG